MGTFDKHFRMEAKDVEEYVSPRPTMFKDSGALEVREIVDGNINYVFRVVDKARKVSAIIKHADLGIRSDSRILGFDRNRIEVEILELEVELAPGRSASSCWPRSVSYLIGIPTAEERTTWRPCSPEGEWHNVQFCRNERKCS
ncbi:MAG: 5-methylthioribose kinase [Spirochaetes bacterium]|nr:MAG: 5-methylthioribose kinase [Spirochaetota bacterium]